MNGGLYRACWQVGDGKPSDYETRLGDALEAAFAAGQHEIADLVKTLNASGLRAADSMAWTEASFAAEMERLGA